MYNKCKNVFYVDIIIDRETSNGDVINSNIRFEVLYR